MHGALLDADYANGRYRYNGEHFASEVALNTAIGATKSGITRTLAPKVIGAELVTNGDFATGDLTGWSGGGTDITVSVVGGKAQLVRGAGGTNGLLTQRVNLGGTPRAFKLEYDPGTNSVRQNAINPGGATAVAASDAAGVHVLRYGAGGIASPAGNIDLQFWNVGNNNTVTVDNVSVTEVRPLTEYAPENVGLIIAGKTPAAASGNKVVFQADADQETDRLRIVWDATKHLHVMVTAGSGSQADIDLGVVEVETDFEVRCSFTKDSIKTSLNGAGLTLDTAANMPAVAYLRIGRSFTGETWDGSIDRVVIFNRVLTDVEMVAPQFGLQVYGDSTAAGDALGTTAAEKWFYLLGTSYTPGRPVNNSGVGGETTGQMLARVRADSAHRGWTTIFMDRPNDNAEAWIANLKAAAALLSTDRWFVMPPVLNSPSGQPDSVATIVGTVQAALLSDDFFAGHTLASVEQASYIAAMDDDATRVGSGEWTHFNAVGQDLQFDYIKAFLGAQGW